MDKKAVNLILENLSEDLSSREQYLKFLRELTLFINHTISCDTITRIINQIDDLDKEQLFDNEVEDFSIVKESLNDLLKIKKC